jgi:GTP cyclohydrolase I
MSKKTYDVESTNSGFANGISTHLAKKIKEAGSIDVELSAEEKSEIIEEAADAFGKFLDALGVDWKNDPNSSDTPRRVAKAYVNDLWKGRFEALPGITAFPSDGYDGIVQESGIPLTSMCSHHHQTIQGKVSIAYIPGSNGKVVGLSKLNRIVEHFGRRGAIQEQLTVAIHDAVDKICEGNVGVAVQIDASHNCVSCRGTKHQGASMQTAKLSGNFKKDTNIRSEFFNNIAIAARNN